jgi:hypothetical protein
MATLIPQRTDNLPDAHKLQAQFALAAFATIKTKNLAYVSIPITSGKRLYDYMEQHGFRSVDEAKADHDAFFKNVVSPNFDAGLKASNEWAAKMNGAVIAPVEFEKHLRTHSQVTWGQDDFMGMWIPLVKEKITHMAMVDGWEYSNGSGEEYLQAVLMQLGRSERSNITISDERGKPLRLDEGITKLGEAFITLTERGIKPRNMAETLGILLEAEQRFNREQSTGVPESPGRKGAKPSAPLYDHKAVVAIGNKVRDILRHYYPDILPVLQKTSSYDFSPMNALFLKKPPVRTPALAA